MAQYGYVYIQLTPFSCTIFLCKLLDHSLIRTGTLLRGCSLVINLAIKPPFWNNQPKSKQNHSFSAAMLNYQWVTMICWPCVFLSLASSAAAPLPRRCRAQETKSQQAQAEEPKPRRLFSGSRFGHRGNIEIMNSNGLVFLGNLNRKPMGFYHQIYGFPVNFPIIQFYE